MPKNKGVLAAAILYSLSILLSSVYVINLVRFFSTHESSTVEIAALVSMVLIIILLLVVAVGLWKLKRWAYVFGVIIGVLSVFPIVVSLWIKSLDIASLFLGIAGLLLYINRKEFS